MPTSSASVSWSRIALFWLLACLISWAGTFVSAWLMPPGSWAAQTIDTSIPVGLGPLLAGLLVFKRTRTVSWGGTSPIKAWLLLAFVVSIWGIVYLTGYQGGKGLTTSILFTLSVLVYCMGEEWGWRGFLYEALLPLSVWQRALLTGALWFSWHFVFYTDLYNPQFAFPFLGMILAGSFGLDATVSRTRSVAVAVCFHALIKLALPQYYLLGTLGLLILLVVRWSVADRPNVADQPVSAQNR